MDTTPPQLDAMTLLKHIEQTPALVAVGMTAPVLERVVQHPEPDRFAVLLASPNDGARHVVEVQLGEADEDQVLRALAHWAVERQRLPGLEHHAAIVAECIPPHVARAVALARRIAPIEALELEVEQREGTLALQVEPVDPPAGADPEAELASALRLRGFLESLDPADPLSARLTGPRPTRLGWRED
ncbi:hypothetical protein [Sinomonas humi]|uniref:Uncharacterized protein n=1 Tax=Sinomonas humi TaxID=1338436 RepID=A0A0B2ALL3_9MICC|nr:hypothetical protein [Sinomonas humi]KHL04510.1 hypothetical protein LK10_04760 [Sinomonas humi]